MIPVLGQISKFSLMIARPRNSLVGCSGNSNAGQDAGEVERDDVLTAPEAHQSHGDNNEQATQVVLLSQKRSPGDALLCSIHRLLNLSDLSRDEGIILVSVAVVLSDDLPGIFEPTDRYKPSGAFREEVDQRQHNAGDGSLES